MVAVVSRVTDIAVVGVVGWIAGVVACRCSVRCVLVFGAAGDLQSVGVKNYT